MAEAKHHIQQIEDIFAKNVYIPNYLEFYDNVTYNIRFYMIPHEAQEKISYEKNLLNKPLTDNIKIPDDQKIIIAETGISSRYSIDSLKIEVVHVSSHQDKSPTSYKMDMKIVEANGCNLINRITAISKIIGYQYYVLQPFYVDIWFSGYDNRTGKPEKVINNEILTYEVIMGEVKSQCTSNGTIYNFSMIPCPFGSLSKELYSLYDVGLIQVNQGDTLGKVAETLENNINSKYFENHPELVDEYKGEKIFTINRLINGDTEYYKIDKDKNENNTIESFFTHAKKVFSLLKNNGMKNEFNGMSKLIEAANKQIDIRNVDLENVSLDLSIPPQTQENSNSVYLQVEGKKTIDQFFQDICAYSSVLNTCEAKTVSRVQTFRNDKGKELTKIYVDVVYYTNPYFVNVISNAKESINLQNGAKSVDKIFIEKNRDEMQLKEAKTIVNSGIMEKKYEWLWNGHNTSVIEVSTTLDKLWYANLGFVNMESTQINSYDNVIKSETLDFRNNLHQISKDLKELKLKEVLEKYNAPLNGVRKLSSDNRLYIDDIYNVISDDTKYEIFSNKQILEQNTTLTESNSNKEATIKNALVTAIKAGYNNIYGTGGESSVTLTILGDPYWLGMFSDNMLYSEEGSLLCTRMPKIAFTMKTCLGESEVGNGKYDMSEITTFSNVFDVCDSVHIFENGRFTQQLHCIIDTSLLSLSRINFK